jgi:HAD superfamily hydrolase (TIGR01484 family)
MDRTVIPNGSQPEDPAARRQLAAFCRLPGVALVYVTGRHRELVEQAISRYDLPAPDFAVTDVGTKIYRIAAGHWMAMADWEERIAADLRGKSREQLRQELSPITELSLQEADKQNTFKLSYYLSLEADAARVLARVENCLNRLAVAASLVWSIDEPAQIGLLDVLPRHATKLHGIRFLQQRLGYRQEELLFAGDSGNDLPVLGSAIRSVLVANASDEIKRQARQLAAQNGHPEALYLANEQAGRWSGNYAAGVLQGVWHFAPEFRDQLRQVGFIR